MKVFREKCEKPPFLIILAQNGQFWTVFGQNGQNGNFFKIALGTFFSHLQAVTNCKVSEKSNERFSSNRVTDRRTYARMDGRESLGLQRLRRETKKMLKCLCIMLGSILAKKNKIGFIGMYMC